MSSSFSPRSRRVSQALISLLVLINIPTVSGQTTGARPEVTVTRREPVVSRQVFNPQRPSPRMPKLTPPESGVCDFDFEIDTGLSYSVGAADAGSVEITIDEIDVVTSLAVRIWTAQGTPPKLLAHEEGHRRICEYYYQNADFIAREVAEPLVGVTLVGRGANRQAAQQDAVAQAMKQISEGYMARTRVRCSAAQVRYDRLTRHGLNALTEDEAIAQVVSEDAEPARESRIAAAAQAQSDPAAVPVATTFWTWKDLIGHPERWPVQATLGRRVTFEGGARFEKGAPVRITKVTAREVEVILPDGSAAAFEPGETDLLAAANAYWTTLSPEQRAIDFATIERDPALQPPVVTSLVNLQFPSGSKPPGTEVALSQIVNRKLHLWSSSDPAPLAVNFTDTDILARARALAALPPAERPDRIAPLLEGTALTLEGKPAKVQSANYYVLYGGSATCGNTQAYTPRFVERMKRILAAHPEVQLVSLSNDATTEAMLTFARQHQMPGVFVPFTNRHGALYRYHVSLMPGITVVDRTGREVGSQTRYAGPASLDRILDQLENELGSRTR